MLYHVTLFDEDYPDNVGMAAHQDEYMAMLMALLSIYAKTTHINFKQGTYGALETFTPPTTLESLTDYCTEMCFTIQTKQLSVDFG